MPEEYFSHPNPKQARGSIKSRRRKKSSDIKYTRGKVQ